MGGGKSHALRWDCYARCLSNPGCVAVLVRESFPQLEANHIRRAQSELPKSLGTYSASRKAFEFANGSVLYFRHIQDDADLNDFQGLEIHLLAVDEAGLLKPEWLVYIRARVRLGGFKPVEMFGDTPGARKAGLAGLPVLPRVLLASNPGGPSHGFLKETFVDAAGPGVVFFDRTTADPRNAEDRGWASMYIPATMDDNRYLDPSYAGQFSLMPEHLVKMYRDGDWSAVAGAFFDCWSTSRNVVPRFSMPLHWTKFRSIDWGHATPFSVGWWAVADGETEVRFRDGRSWCAPRGAMVRYREWYGAQKHRVTGKTTNVGLRIDADEVGRRMLEMTPKGEIVAYTVADGQMWERRAVGPTQAEKMMRAGVPLKPASKQRHAGWQEMYGRMRGVDGVPLLYVTEDCREFQRTVPPLMASEKDPEDIPKGGEDHIADEARYACMSRPMVTDAPQAETQKWQVATDLTFRDRVERNARRLREREMVW